MGQSEDWLALQMALAPCLLGYGAVAQMLHVHAATQKDGNTYWPWIENYVAQDYTEAVRLGSELIENSIRECSPSRIEELVKIFIHGTKVCQKSCLVYSIANQCRWKSDFGKCSLQIRKKYPYITNIRGIKECINV